MTMQNRNDTASKSRGAFLLLLAISITLLFFWLIKGFVLALVMAVVLAGLTHPIHCRLVKRLRGREGMAATLTVLLVLVLVLVIVPGLLFLGVLWRDAVGIGDRVAPWLAEHVQNPAGLRKAIEESPTLQRLLPYQDQIVQKAGQLVGKAASFVAQAVVGGVTGAAEFFLMLFVTLYGMFYFLKEGRSIINGVLDYTPLSTGDREHLVTTFHAVTRATLRGTFVIGIVQGGLAGVAFAVVGIEGAVFWGAIMMVLSIIPGIGTGLVWVPAVIYLAMAGRFGAAVGLALWCVVVVGTADNVLRPMLVGRDTKMPDLMVLLTTLGGLVLFGAAGIVIGPIVGALFIAAWFLWGAAAQEARGSRHTPGVPADDPGQPPGPPGIGNRACTM